MDSSHSASGYIHSLSPVKKSKSNIPYYDFNLEVSPTQMEKVVAFNVQAHKTLVAIEQ
eukprot:gene4471-5065_t